MSAFIPNIAKGKVAQLATLPAANDAIIWVAFANAGLEADSVLMDKTTLTATVSGATDEATFTGYARQTATSVTVTVDNTNDRVDIDCADPSFSPTSSQALGKIGVFYDPDTTTGTDADLIPLMFDDFQVTTPTSGTVGYTVATAGFARAA